MKPEQLEVIVQLLAGTQAAIVHMCNVLDSKGIATKEELQKSFEQTSALMPAPMAAMVLRQIAQGIQHSQAADPTQELRNHLH